MWLLVMLKDLWPFLSAIASGGIIPLAIWWGRKMSERDKIRQKHEERRTKAAEDIPQALRDLKDMLAESVRTQGEITRQAVHIAKEEILDAIRGEEIKEVKDLIRERLISSPEVGQAQIPSSPRSVDSRYSVIRGSKP